MRARSVLGTTIFTLLALLGAHTARAARCQIVRYPSIPVTLKDMKALIPVKINGRPIVLAVDSGAFYSSLSPE
jgi:hypothetical protein